MATKTMIFLGIALCLVCQTAHGQVLTTAETIGKNKQAVLFTENRLFDDVQLNIAYFQYIRGVSSKFDLYVTIGGTRILKQNQAWVGIGGNYNLFRFEKTSISLFNVASVPLHRRVESSTVLLNSALVVSHDFGKFNLYSGLNSLWPIGAREHGFFTPPTKKINVPIGIFIPRGKWGVFAEADIGHLKAIGLGVSYSF